MATDLEISPLRGVGPILFGMVPSEIEEILGPATARTKNADGELEERRDEMTVRYDADSETVAEVAFGPESIVTIEGVAIMQARDPVGEIVGRSENVVECLGFLVSLDLGVTLTGYYDNDVEQRALTVFAPGRWDSMSEHFVKFTR